jgi:uncharacterized protein YbjT (DUF2867 family)
MPKPITVAVAGATGTQGGALARLLLDRGHRVLALTRRPSSKPALLLAALGAELAEADLDDASAVRRALDGVDAFFLVATPFEGGVSAEIRQGRQAAKVAKEAGVKHLVYSSVASADQQTGVPHFDSKHEIETYLERLAVPHTVVAPVFFMENLLGPLFRQGLRSGKLWLPLPPDRRLQAVAVADIAGFVRLILERPAEFQGQRVELASDSLTGMEMARILTAVTGTLIEYAQAPLDAVRRQSEELALMWEWLDRVGYQCPLESLHGAHPEVGWHDFGHWAREQDWSLIGASSPAQPPA